MIERNNCHYPGEYFILLAKIPVYCKNCDILNGIWIDHLDCVDKKPNTKAENTDGVGTPARLSNDEIWLFGSKMGGQIYFRLV